MSLRYALLALIRVGPLSGYQLQKEFSLSVGHVWHARDSQIYPELRRMEKDGLIEGEEQLRGKRGTRRIYHITPQGEEDFLDWMGEPLDYQRIREPAYLRAAYLESATPEQARTFFTAHITEWERELAQWQTELSHIEHRSNPMLRRRLELSPEEEHEKIVAYKRFAYEGLIERALGEIAWAKRGLALVEELDGPSENQSQSAAITS